MSSLNSDFQAAGWHRFSMATKRKKETDVTHEFISKTQPLEITQKFSFTEKQRQILDIAAKNHTKVVFISGSAGTGKTMLAIYTALLKLRDKKINKLTYLRNPIESSSGSIGFLPSDKNAKMAPYLQPAIDQLQEFLTPFQIKSLTDTETVEVIPIGFCKGMTFRNSLVISDEAQDLSVKELCMIMGRLGRGSQLWIIGDTKQCAVKKSGFDEVFNAFSDESSKHNGIHTFTFGPEDCMRHGLGKFIIEKFEKLGL